MQLSNRLTFSLASLIVLIGLLAAPAFVHAAAVSTVEFTSTPPYTAGDKVQVTVTFSGAVDVNTTSGTPHVSLADNDTNLADDMPYVSGTGTAKLVFESVAIAAGDDSDGLGISANISLNNGTIMDAGTQTAATGYIYRCAYRCHADD